MSDGGRIPATGRELIANLQRRIAMAERSLKTKANAEKVETLDKYVDQILAEGTGGDKFQVMFPVGSPYPVFRTTLEDGEVALEGQVESRTGQYAALFAEWGTTFGAGDGSTTFQFPDLRGVGVMGYFSGQSPFDAIGNTGGETEHTLTTSEMPSHSHGTGDGRDFVTTSGNAVINLTGRDFPSSGGTANFWYSTGNSDTANELSATATTGGGDPHNNLSPYITARWVARFEAVTAPPAGSLAAVSPSPDTVVQRDGDGAAYVAPGTDGEHAVNLNQLNAASIASQTYVDDIVRMPDGASPLASAPPGDYADGFTLDSTGTGITDGWPNNYGTIVTQRVAGHRIVQTFYVKGAATEPGAIYYRTGVDDATWSPFQVIGGDTDWLDIPWDSGYEQFSSSYQTDARLIGNVVYFRGLVKPSSGSFAAGANMVIGNLPSGIPAPTQKAWCAGMVTAGDDGAAFNVNPNGSLEIRVGTTSTPYIGLGSASYVVG